MMRRRRGLRPKLSIDPTPPIFADLALELDDGTEMGLNVERPGWLKEARALYKRARRVGLCVRGQKEPAVWMDVNGSAPNYFSRVIGHIGPHGHNRIRVACIECGGVRAWLHKDGQVEIGPEPSWRE